MADAPATIADKITIAVDTDDCTPHTVELAVELAAAIKGTLEGLFIENPDLLSTARLPFSCEITLATGQQRVLNPEVVETGYRRQATRFRHLLEQKARQSIVQFSFEAIRGRRKDVVTRTRPAGYLILERRAHNPRWQSGAALPHKRILVVDGQEQSRLIKALQFLCNKFPQYAIDVLWVADEVQQVRHPALPPRADIKTLSPEHLDSALHSPLDYILVSAAVTPESLDHLLSEAPCPIIVAS